ncbi:MAG: copper-binding protein [Burkholderiales bacterium]|nr:copper-binding protein [Burkholderiales bacterium]
MSSPRSLMGAPIAAIALIVAAASHAAAPAPAAEHAAGPASAADPASALADGEVRRIDKGQGKITLRHGPIANLAMPGMTMVFKVAEPGLLDGREEGEKIRFKADRVNGALTVTAIERPAR